MQMLQGAFTRLRAPSLKPESHNHSDAILLRHNGLYRSIEALPSISVVWVCSCI